MKIKLASVRKIDKIESIEGADNIEKVLIDGWQCVARKGEFKEGDLCVYFEIDSYLPIKPEFEFLRKSSYRKMGDKEGFRLKTIRLKGTLSQGLALPISFFELGQHELFLRYGDDITDGLEVIKWDPPIPAELDGKVKGYIPSFIRKTDQERVQNIWKDIQNCEEEFEITVKLDGTSCTYYFKDGKFGVCGRTLEFEDTGNTFWKIAKACNIEQSLREIGRNIALQGEIIGPGIQGNNEKLKECEFHAFDIWDIDEQRYLRPYERNGIIFERISVKPVPILGRNITLKDYIEKHKLPFDINSFLQAADGPSLNPDAKREGLVFKSESSQLRFKVISNQYLLNERD